jgi:hypothetical protein
MGNYGHLLTGSLQAFFNASRRAHRYRGDQHQNLAMHAVSGNLIGNGFNVFGGVFRQVDDFSPLHHGLQVGGIHEPAGSHAAPHNVT